MPGFEVCIAHSKAMANVFLLIDQLLPQLMLTHQGTLRDVRYHWDGPVLHFSFSAQGYVIFGTAAISEDNVTIGGELPLVFGVFRGTIESKLREIASRLLSERLPWEPL
ncbi:MAG: polyhydroxyalkanoic acid system family protein [Candidatus Komeilibacteria bacterium]